MQRTSVCVLVTSILGIVSASAEPMPFSPDYYGRAARVAAPSPRAAEPAEPVARVQLAQSRYGHAQRPQGHMGGGFIEALFGGDGFAPEPPQVTRYERSDRYQQYQQMPEEQRRYFYARSEPGQYATARPTVDPKYERQIVDYDGQEAPGTIIVDTPRRFLFLVQPGGKALRYGIGVGRPGFTWAGAKNVTAKREWPDWRPPAEMLKRRPDLPTFMAGGPENPLGARALYLGSSLYRIHGSNEPWTIGQAVSSGCIRMRNEDVTDLYERVKVGTRVIVI